MASDSIAQQAEELITGDRREAYGPVRASFQAVADIWTALINTRHPASSGVVLGAQDVALMMAAYKLQREANRPATDNRRDAIGYLLLLQELEAGPDPGECEVANCTNRHQVGGPKCNEHA